MPSYGPTLTPTHTPSRLPTVRPTTNPTYKPSFKPTDVPTHNPSTTPSYEPSKRPTYRPSIIPSHEPTVAPTHEPSVIPSVEPSQISSYEPSSMPSNEPSLPLTLEPSMVLSYEPSFTSTYEPSFTPSTEPFSVSTYQPTDIMSSWEPSSIPNFEPSVTPSYKPSFIHTGEPTPKPTNDPSIKPSYEPTWIPTYVPSTNPTYIPSVSPTCLPSTVPSNIPTREPLKPTYVPSISPSYKPPVTVTLVPSSTFSTVKPIAYTPTVSPSQHVFIPSNIPTQNGTVASSYSPTNIPSIRLYKPSYSPLSDPTTVPTPTRPYEVDVLFFTGAIPNQIIGTCAYFTFPLSGKMIEACGYSNNGGINPLWYKYMEYYKTETGLGLKYGSLNYEIGIASFVQIDISSIKNPINQPQYSIGSTFGGELFCIYGSNLKGIRGSQLLYSSTINYEDGTYISFPSGYVNYAFISFSACSFQKRSTADILLMSFSIHYTNQITSLPTSAVTRMLQPSKVPVKWPKPSKNPPPNKHQSVHANSTVAATTSMISYNITSLTNASVVIHKLQPSKVPTKLNSTTVINSNKTITNNIKRNLRLTI